MRQGKTRAGLTYGYQPATRENLAFGDMLQHPLTRVKGRVQNVTDGDILICNSRECLKIAQAELGAWLNKTATNAPTVRG